MMKTIQNQTCSKPECEHCGKRGINIGGYGWFTTKSGRRRRYRCKICGGTRRVQEYKRTQDWRAGPFRSSSPRGEPQIWGVSEAMSAIRVPRTRRENTIQQWDATFQGGDLDPGPGRTWTRTC